MPLPAFRLGVCVNWCQRKHCLTSIKARCMTHHKGPDIMFTYMEALWLSFVCGHLSTVECTLTGGVATCRSNPVIERETGVMNISFSPKIDFARDRLFVYLSKKGGQDILHCGEIKKPPPAECKILKDDDDGFTTQGLSGHNLILVVTRATPDLQGEYVLGGYVNGSPVSPSICYFMVSKVEVYKGHSESSSGVVSIVAPILGIALIAFVIAIAVVVVKKRLTGKRSKKDVASMEAEQMYHTAGDIDPN